MEAILVGANDSAPDINDVLEVLREDEAGQRQMDPGAFHPDPGIVSSVPPGAYIKILEQPAPKQLRFRYECEGRSAGSLPGRNSTPDNKTFPTIQIVGFKGRAVIVVSCVTKEAPHRPHPHNLVGKDSCKKGVCTVELNESMIASFPNLGIQCVKKKDIEEALKARENIKVDPFRTGFGHRNQPGSIDLNSLRLCFQAFLEGPERGKFMVALPPVVSDPIYDKKAMADLIICRLSQCAGSAGGGTDIILLCEKVAKEDISVRFYEEKEGEVVWEAFGDFTPTMVHKQVAIAFKTPKYKTLQISEPVKVWIELRRPSDGESSDPRPFTIYPVESGRPPFFNMRKSLFAKATDSILFNNNLNQKQSSEKENKVSSDINQDDKISDKVVIQEVLIVDEEMESPEVVEETQDEGSLHELLEQVKDLEEMFPQGDIGSPELYTSLQMAMKNPMPIDTSSYEDVPPPRPTAAKPKSQDSDDVLPPLPPKRARRTSSMKNLPPIPEKTKLNIFQKLFSSKRKKAKSLQGSVGSKGSSKTINSEILVEKGGMDLTEAEHYALYTTFAPRATLSECDDVSFYYSPVEKQQI